MNKNSIIFVTGAGGFLGSELIGRLLACNTFQVYALTSQYEKLMKRYQNYSQFHVLGLNDFINFDFSKVDVLINCAFPRNEDGVEMAKGLKFIREILTKASNDGVGAVINISSQSVYSQKRLESATEETELNLETKYAVGKYATELMVETICGKIPHTNLRIASLIGVGFNQRLVNKFVKQALKGDTLCITGGKQRFGFMDIRDAALAIISIIDSSVDDWSSVYNLGSDESWNLEEITKLVQSVGSEYLDINIQQIEGDVWHNSTLNLDRFYRRFKWKPLFSLEDTIRDIFVDELSNLSQKRSR